MICICLGGSLPPAGCNHDKVTDIVSDDPHPTLPIFPYNNKNAVGDVKEWACTMPPVHLESKI